MSARDPVHVALLTIELMIPWSDSLKSKRRVIRSIKDRLGARFNVSVAEIGFLEEWQRAAIGVVMIGNDRQHLESCLSAANRMVEEVADIHLLHVALEWR
ncbi:MAG: DUF503 domain-containing protein [Gammaproteobacteria bacterium]|jgi:uncharacterized protein YlxP (DUF503 family)|nr:DUF503 domain-containing protein [Gammaproteobacteria bacterium]